MTPAEEFAAKRLEAEALIRQHAPERLQAQLVELLRPAIALTATRADDAQIPVGASKFGGAPDVPADFEWPMWNDKPLGFLAQINLEEVAPFDVEGLLPKSGLLSFFFNWIDWGGTGEDLGRVVWINEATVSRAFSIENRKNVVTCRQISTDPYFELQVPYDFASDVLDEDEFQLLFQLPEGLLVTPFHPHSLNKMLGYGESCYGTPKSWGRGSEDHPVWHLLLDLWLSDVLDDPSVAGEALEIQFEIAPEDLRHLCFYKTQVSIGQT